MSSIQTLYPVQICPAEELPPGSKRIVEIGSLSIVLTNTDNQYYAYLNMCPHQGAPLETGSISGAMASPEPHKYEYTCHNQIVRCPLHGWGFDMKTGESLFDPKVKIKTFELAEENGMIILYMKRTPSEIRIRNLALSCS